MRVVWSFSVFFLACGGRTLGDPVFDEVPRGGALGAGGSATGGVSYTGGKTQSAGGTSGTGAGSFGGSFGFGGVPSTGGFPSTGTGGFQGKGGFPATGGTGSGGAPFVDKTCTQFCDTIQGLCGMSPGKAGSQCAIGCSQPLVTSSPACQAATRGLLECVNKALQSPQATCTGVAAIALLYCSDQLLKANACDSQAPDLCSESIQAQGDQCERVRRCGATEYRTICSGSSTFANCRCTIDGKTTTKAGFSGTFDICELATSYSCP